MADIPDFVHHYTSHEAFLGIVNSGTLWATDILYLNDSEEFTYTYKLAAEVIEGYPSTDQGSLREIIEDLENGLPWIEESSVYVASFSAKEDLLSQWRAYCPQYGGVSLAFDGAALSQRAKSASFRFSQCIYDSEAQVAQVKEVFDTVLAHADKGAASKLGWERLLQLAPLLKHPSFEEEQEWRLVASLIPTAAGNVRYRAGRSMLIPYIEIRLEEGGVLPMDHAMLGPTPHKDLAFLSAYRYLLPMVRKGRVPSAGFFPAIVRNSRIPYRSW